MKDRLEEKLKQAIERKDEFSASILITRLENLGYSVLTLPEWETLQEKTHKEKYGFCSDDIPF